MKLIVLGLLLSFTAFAQTPQPDGFKAINVGPSQYCMIPKVDGERVPFPLRNANSKFDLVAGETYLLNGTLVMNSGKVFLKVDFNSQPWLATQAMLSFPYFEISSMNVSTVHQYNGHIVQVAVVAKREESCSTHIANLKLDPILPPSSSAL
jgi:hypothetical protein